MFKTVPVVSEFLQASFVDVAQHARRTPRNLPPLPQTLQLALAACVGLAAHIVGIVGITPRANEEGCAHQRCRTGADFCDLGDRVRERGCVDESLLVEDWLTGSHFEGVVEE